MADIEPIDHDVILDTGVLHDHSRRRCVKSLLAWRRFQQGLRRVGDIMLDVAWVSGVLSAVSEVLQRGAELLIPCGSSASVAAKRLPAVTLDENRGIRATLTWSVIAAGAA